MHASTPEQPRSERRTQDRLFTGTPLLRRDRLMTRDLLGNNIHTYEFHERVADGVILDPSYVARDVPHRADSQ